MAGEDETGMRKLFEITYIQQEMINFDKDLPMVILWKKLWKL